MKFAGIYLLFFGLFIMSASGQSSSLRDFENLKEQRDKALETATQPIREKYITALDTLLQRAIKSGDVDAAAQMKAELEVAQGAITPAFVIGVWRQVGPDGQQSVFIIEPEGKALWISSAGRTNPNIWKIDGKKLIVGPANDEQYNITYTIDGPAMKGELADGTKGFVATKAP